MKLLLLLLLIRTSQTFVPCRPNRLDPRELLIWNSRGSAACRGSASSKGGNTWRHAGRKKELCHATLRQGSLFFTGTFAGSARCRASPLFYSYGESSYASLNEPFNVVLTHSMADFDSLASACGLAKLWSTPPPPADPKNTAGDVESNKNNKKRFQPTYVVLPRGKHPQVGKFLSLHKHLFPIRSLRQLPDLSNLDRLGLVDAQRLERIGPASSLVPHAKRITVVDHHVDGQTDIEGVHDYVVDEVGSVTTLIVEQLRDAKMQLTPPEATLLALGIHADTGSLCYDCTTPRDATALAWALRAGASQSAIAEHAHIMLSGEQQRVLKQAIAQLNTTHISGTSFSTVLLRAQGFVNGLATVTQDVLDLSSSDVLIMAVVYDTTKTKDAAFNRVKVHATEELLYQAPSKEVEVESERNKWKMGPTAERSLSLRASFDRHDSDGSGYLELNELKSALRSGGVVATDSLVNSIMGDFDLDEDGSVSFKEFQEFALRVSEDAAMEVGGKANMILIGRAKAGIHLKSLNLAKIFKEEFGGGGHPKAASATCRLTDFSEGKTVLQRTLDKLVRSASIDQPRVGDFMTSPVVMVNQNCDEEDVEELFKRSSVRALPVVDDEDHLVGMVTYKELAAAQTRLVNKKKKNKKKVGKGQRGGGREGTKVKGWMLHHIPTVGEFCTLSEAEKVLLEGDVGVIPVVEGGSSGFGGKVKGLITRTDMLRQHQYYDNLYYNKQASAEKLRDGKSNAKISKTKPGDYSDLDDD